MTKRMLIDAAHAGEVRVAVVENQQLEEFDFESASKKQIKGNVYLAKVTRVEPSLQAAFVEYGGSKQGFLPFSEIHYDYFSIPVADKKKLASEAAGLEPADETEDEEAAADEGSTAEAAEEETEGAEDGEAEGDAAENAEDEFDVPIKRSTFYRKYKIQEVIKRNQILLVQVIKEERGNKGASLTTYISLAGRYCVFMPNTGKQGGVSRRISSFEDRKRLKSILSDLETPKGSSLIIRTAGLDRKKPEIKRDLTYLTKMWDEIRDCTVSSTAPTLVYEEGNIVKRAVRDFYDSDIDEVVVEGEEALKRTKDFMKMMMPSHVRRVKECKEKGIFWYYQIEDQLAELYENTVYLKSGGYIVINPTEALVSIDVNSGRSTRERNIEETAVKTNIEAANEVARQLRLRDLAGLIVIDFIDMLSLRNKRAVERELKQALARDRARIQVGRISTFGLLEMSRQRLRSSLVEANTVTCPRCNGVGYVRSHNSTSLMLVRAIRAEAQKGKAEEVTLRCSVEMAYYLLNNHRQDLMQIEHDAGVKVLVQGDDTFTGTQHGFGSGRKQQQQRRSSSQQQQGREGRGGRGGRRGSGRGYKRDDEDKRGGRSRRDEESDAAPEAAEAEISESAPAEAHDEPAPGNSVDEKEADTKNTRRRGGGRTRTPRGGKSGNARSARGGNSRKRDSHDAEDDAIGNRDPEEEGHSASRGNRRGGRRRASGRDERVEALPRGNAAPDIIAEAEPSLAEGDASTLRGLWKKISTK